MELNKLMFREYDIRGIWEKDINEEISYHIGRAFATKLLSYGKDTMIVGYDNRISSKTIEDLIKKGFYFFIHENITILYDLKIIVVGDLEEEINKIKDIKDLRILSEKDYFVFQNLLRESIGEEKVEPFKVETNPRIREIKAKGRRRERAKRKSQQGISLGTLLSAICCMGIGITPLNIGEISYAALSSIKDMSQKKEKYEIDVRSLLAGADSKKVKPVYWITEEKLD